MHGALSAFSNAIAADPKSKIAYTKRAATNSGLGHLQAASRDYTTALDIEPTSISTRIQRGQLYLRMCKFDDAEKDFDTVLQAKPEHDGAKQGKEKVTTGRGHLQTAEVCVHCLLVRLLCGVPLGCRNSAACIMFWELCSLPQNTIPCRLGRFCRGSLQCMLPTRSLWMAKTSRGQMMRCQG